MISKEDASIELISLLEKHFDKELKEGKRIFSFGEDGNIDETKLTRLLDRYRNLGWEVIVKTDGINDFDVEFK